MKTTSLIFGVLLAAGSARAADTNAPTKPPPPTTHIESETAYADGKTRTLIYEGNVRVNDPRMNLRCERLTVKIGALGGHPESMIAETNVVITAVDEKAQTNRATGDKLVYTYKVESGVTNELIVLTGDPLPRIVSPQMDMTGEKIYWDRINDRIWADKPRMDLRQDVKPTNAPPAAEPATNAPPPANHAP
jgi:lipopolysaccharide export system protein LptA